MDSWNGDPVHEVCIPNRIPRAMGCKRKKNNNNSKRVVGNLEDGNSIMTHAGITGNSPRGHLHKQQFAPLFKTLGFPFILLCKAFLGRIQLAFSFPQIYDRVFAATGNYNRSQPCSAALCAHSLDSATKPCLSINEACFIFPIEMHFMPSLLTP